MVSEMAMRCVALQHRRIGFFLDEQLVVTKKPRESSNNCEAKQKEIEIMKKSLILIGVLTLCSLIANAKTYDIALSNSIVAGTVQLAPGQYHLKVTGNTATFTDMNTFKTFTAPVKVEQVPKKFDMTTIDTNNQSGTDHIQKIELGGSNTALDFGE
jgi:hypothetical protein